MLRHLAVERRGRVVLLLFLLPIAALALRVRSTWFLCDDAFISFRYARNLLEGHGLVFNPGERVEGYTNLLWVLEVAGLWCLGLRPEWAAPALSAALTLGTLCVVAAAARRLERGRPVLAAWIAVTLVATSCAFADWSTSGLETRQFTFLVVAGLHAATRARESTRWALVAGLAFAAAELTRPEGLLLFACVFACWAAWAWRDRARCIRPALAMLLPFAAIVAAHFVWRRAYYGDWLPNTYHAKHVRAWYECGWRYVAAATIELGMWVWLPLAALALGRSLRERGLAMLPFAAVVPHLWYQMHIGGDHFAFRPLDFWLPALAPAAAASLLSIARGPRLALALLVPTLAYSHAMDVAHHAAAMRSAGREQTAGMTVRVTADVAPWLAVMPGMSALADHLNRLRAFLVPHGVAAPVREHAELGRHLVAGYRAYEAVPPGTFGADTVSAMGAVGVIPFHLRELRVVDTLGLTDAVVARNPAVADNAGRIIAHDRRPPPGYLHARGTNVFVHPRAASADDALAMATSALRIADDLWLPLSTTDLELARRRWPAADVVTRHRVDGAAAAENEVRVRGSAFVGRRLLSTFERGQPGLDWLLEGSAAIGPLPEQLYGAVGSTVLGTAVHLDASGAAGVATSSEFRADGDGVLVLFAAGKGPGVSVQLRRGETVVWSWSRFEAPHLTPIALPIGAFAGEPLRLQVRDDGEGWLVVDHVLLATEVPIGANDPSRRWSPPWTANREALAPVLTIEPLSRRRGVAVSSSATVTFRNPLPVAARLALAPLAATACAELEVGPWVIGGETVETIHAGATATCRMSLAVREPVPARGDWFALEARLEPATGAEPGAGAFTLPVGMPWREVD